jgi:DNA-binding Xre family transcriptional regulator
MKEISTKGRLTRLLGKYQLATGQRLSLRRLADTAAVNKDLVYRLDAGQARYVDLQALARLCDTLNCRVEEILVWKNNRSHKEDNDRLDESL